MRITGRLIALCLGAVLVLPAIAVAATPSSVVASASQTASRTYDLDFTLPTEGKSGCLVCHGDPNLQKIDSEGARTIYVDIEELRESAHRDTPCTGCHVDFAYKTPHENALAGDDWREVAKLACKNCHDKSFSNYASSAHSPAATPGEDATAVVNARKKAGKPTEVPFCGDCHGGHAIPKHSDRAGRDALRATALTMCGECHTAEAASYDDYYHGAAYRTGASDAPTCWDCHAAHLVFPADDRRSTLHETRIVPTCGKKGCHPGADDALVEYAEFVHGGQERLEDNAIWSILDSFRSAVSDAFDSVTSLFGE